MGRSPCCDKLGLKKGPWTPEEDQKLLAYIEEHGHGNWRALPGRAGLQRCGKSCRLRWTNYLRPDIKHGKFSLQEEQTIIQLHALLGNRWSAIATHLSKRTDNEIKNYWNTHLKKRLAKMGIDPVSHKPKNDTLLLTGDGAQHTRNAATLSHMAQWESARLEAEARLARQSKLRSGPSGPPSFPANHHPQHHINNFNSTSTMPRCLDVLQAWHGVWPSTSTATDPAEGVGPGGGGFRLTGGSRQLGIESPTSTLSFSENAQPIPTVGTATAAVIQFLESNHNTHQDNHNHYHNYHDHHGTTMMENSLSFRSSSGLNDITEANNADNNNEDQDEDDNDYDHDHHDHDQSFMEGFTELLLGAATTTSNITCGEKGQEEDQQGGAMTDDNNNTGRGGSSTSSGSYYYEDNKNYWNSILNLVNSSPSHSTMF